MIELQDLDKIAEEINWYDTNMTRAEYELFQREYEDYLNKLTEQPGWKWPDL